MPFQVRHVTEAEMPRCIDIQFAAFASYPFNPIMFPPESTDAASKKAAYLERNLKAMRESRSSNFIVCIDDAITPDASHSQIISYARWEFHLQERPESEWNVDENRQWGEGANVEAANYFMRGVVGSRRRAMQGKRHALLDILDTDEKHQGRGAGAALVKWGTDWADREGLECMLEGTPAGLRLYQKSGFRQRELLEFDMERFGGQGKTVLTSMIRPIKGPGPN